MANVTFSHPMVDKVIGSLNITTNPDQIIWSYGLNTAVYPTYGGEVVQILSVYFGDMTVAGTIRSYADLERIYSWFIVYMQYATQGRDTPSFDQHPVQFYYPERGWHFQIWPKSLPGFRYGRDVVAPTWKLTASVKEPDATMADQIKDYAAFNTAHSGQFDTFGQATADFGFTSDLVNNPWASPDADPNAKGQTTQQSITKQLSHLSDSYSGFVSDYQNGSLNKLPQFQDISGPPSLTPSANNTKSKKTKK